MIERQEALEQVRHHIEKENLVKHVLAVEAVMFALARHLGEDENLWRLTGLLHDLDLAQTEETPERHGFVAAEMLEARLPPESLQAIRTHPGHFPPQSRLDWALFCADPVTGLIIAAALMHPSRSISELPLKSLKKRFKDKRFAAGANREAIQACEKLGMELTEFLDLSLTAMKGISGELGM